MKHIIIGGLQTLALFILAGIIFGLGIHPATKIYALIVVTSLVAGAIWWVFTTISREKEETRKWQNENSTN